MISAVTATARGFAAVGAAGTSAAAWLSADGRTWRQVGADRARGRGPGGARLCRGERCQPGRRGHRVHRLRGGSPFAEVSADAGATWTPIGFPVPVGAGSGTAVTALTTAAGRFTATGTYGTRAGSEVVVWTLPGRGHRGTGWTAATPQGAGLAGAGTDAKRDHRAYRGRRHADRRRIHRAARPQLSPRSGNRRSGTERDLSGAVAADRPY